MSEQQQTGIDGFTTRDAVSEAFVVEGIKDDPPKKWVGWSGGDLTPEEIAEGNRLGETIDVDDDT